MANSRVISVGKIPREDVYRIINALKDAARNQKQFREAIILQHLAEQLEQVAAAE